MWGGGYIDVDWPPDYLAGTHLTSTWLLPEPSSTGMAFKDLRFDHKKNEV